MIPSITSIILLIPQISILGTDLFKGGVQFQEAFVPLSIASNSLLMITGLLQIILSGWSLVLSIIGISEAQNFSIGKTILNMVMPGILLVATFTVIAFLFKFLN